MKYLRVSLRSVGHDSEALSENKTVRRGLCTWMHTCTFTNTQTHVTHLLKNDSVAVLGGALL